MCMEGLIDSMCGQWLLMLRAAGAGVLLMHAAAVLELGVPTCLFLEIWLMGGGDVCGSAGGGLVAGGSTQTALQAPSPRRSA